MPSTQLRVCERRFVFQTWCSFVSPARSQARVFHIQKSAGAVLARCKAQSRHKAFS